MTTQAKLNIAAYAASAMMLLAVFSKPLHIPDPIQWALILGVFVPIGFLFYLVKRVKQERTQNAAPGEQITASSHQVQRKARKGLLISMALGALVGLSAPFWMPLTGTTLGPKGDFIVGLITVAIVCAICGYRLRKL